jgi:squalene-hopene/tetraprenyl-beta-curcumene cyclase
MARLRERIWLGGIQAANSYTKVNLSLFDLYPREGTPSIPPEIMLLPGKLLYQMSSWTRAIVVSLAIVHAHDPKRPVPAGFNLDELFIPGASTGLRRTTWLSWRKTFVSPTASSSFGRSTASPASARPPFASANTGCSSA